MALELKYAGFVPRLVSLVIDGIILLLVQIVLGMVLGEAGATGAASLGFIISLVYTVYFLTSIGQTPGMKLMSIKLINSEGGLLTLGQAVIRVFVAIVSGMVFGIGYLWMLWDGNKQTWHDKAVGSLVVRV